jgi:hypothetical protein
MQSLIDYRIGKSREHGKLRLRERGTFNVSSNLDFERRKTPAFLSLGGTILSIALMTCAAQASKASDFSSTVDESISGQMIANSMYRYIGKHVDLHCTVHSIPYRDAFNAFCGPDGAEDNIAIIHNVSGLSRGQKIRILGVVKRPLEVPDAYGTLRNFPTVRARFIELE